MIRIAGIVKAAQVARNRLQAGIPASEVASFQEFVTDTLAQVEKICTQAQVNPEKLPTPSRKAYYFLKKLDLNNLPVADEGSNTAPATAPGQTIRIDNIRRQQQAILERIADLAKNPTSDISRQELIAHKLAQNVREIERICEARQATPEALTDAARNTYAWMKFLTEDPYLDLHIEATRRIRQILETMPELPETLELAVEFSNIASLYKWKKTDKALELQINEGFIAAEDDILEAIAATAVSGKTKAANQKIKQFSVSEPCREILFRLDAIANIETETSRGRCYDLDLLFAKVNREYFQGEMAKPRLTWNRAFTKRCFGYYERSRDRVVISQTLDDSRVPEFVVEYVLYHELLHKKHGEQWQGGRRAVHTKSFRRDELKFAQYNEAEAWLSSLSNL